MEVIPAVDLRRGEVVRLHQGRDDRRRGYGADPAGRIGAWRASGARWVHVVDLDAAFGEPPQRDLLAALAALPERPRLQLGGGLRDEEAVRWALAAGFDRVVIGSMVTRQPELFVRLADEEPLKLVPAVDATRGRVRVGGWQDDGGAVDVVARGLEGLPCPAVLVTDVERDGTGHGANLALARRVAAASGIPAILSGGVASLDELRAAARFPAIWGAVIGRALLDGSLDLAAALAAVATEKEGR